MKMRIDERVNEKKMELEKVNKLKSELMGGREIIRHIFKTANVLAMFEDEIHKN